MRTRGFSLLETLMYIALFGVIMQGAFAGIVAISESAERNQAKAYIEEEGDFLVAKISYEISQASSTEISPEKSTQINLARDNGEDISIESNDGGLFITRGDSTPVEFSSNRVSVSDFVFKKVANGTTQSIVFSFTLQAPSEGGRLVSEDFTGSSFPNL
jgi:hypothetical protein